jgi:hypothetical protein
MTRLDDIIGVHKVLRNELPRDKPRLVWMNNEGNERSKPQG